MKGSYQIVGKKETRKLAELLVENGQIELFFKSTDSGQVPQLATPFF